MDAFGTLQLETSSLYAAVVLNLSYCQNVNVAGYAFRGVTLGTGSGIDQGKPNNGAATLDFSYCSYLTTGWNAFSNLQFNSRLQVAITFHASQHTVIERSFDSFTNFWWGAGLLDFSQSVNLTIQPNAFWQSNSNFALSGNPMYLPNNTYVAGNAVLNLSRCTNLAMPAAGDGGTFFNLQVKAGGTTSTSLEHPGAGAHAILDMSYLSDTVFTSTIFYVREACLDARTKTGSERRKRN